MTVFRTAANTYAIQQIGYGGTGAINNTASGVFDTGYRGTPHVPVRLALARIISGAGPYPDIEEQWYDSTFGALEEVAGAVARFWDERFEGAGYEETWSLGESVGVGATLDEDFSTASVPGGAPSGWDSQCLKMDTPGSVNCQVVHAFSSARTVFYSHIEFVVGAESLANNDVVRLARFMTPSGTDWIILSLRQTAGQLELRVNIRYDGGADHFFNTNIALSTRYRVEVKWDTITDTWEYRLDGTSIGSGTLTGASATTAIEEVSIGAQTNDLLAYTVYFDNFVLDTDNWIFTSATAVAATLKSTGHITVSSSVVHPLSINLFGLGYSALSSRQTHNVPSILIGRGRTQSTQTITHSLSSSLGGNGRVQASPRAEKRLAATSLGAGVASYVPIIEHRLSINHYGTGVVLSTNQIQRLLNAWLNGGSIVSSPITISKMLSLVFKGDSIIIAPFATTKLLSSTLRGDGEVLSASQIQHLISTIFNEDSVAFTPTTISKMLSSTLQGSSITIAPSTIAKLLSSTLRGDGAMSVSFSLVQMVLIAFTGQGRGVLTSSTKITKTLDSLFRGTGTSTLASGIEHRLSASHYGAGLFSSSTVVPIPEALEFVLQAIFDTDISFVAVFDSDLNLYSIFDTEGNLVAMFDPDTFSMFSTFDSDILAEITWP